MSPSTQSSPATLRGNFVLLRAGALRVLLPQGDVGAAEYLPARPQPTGEPGILRVEGSEGRCFAALSAGMTLLDECPAERFVVATLGSESDGLAWCWDDLQVLIDLELKPRPLPQVLLAPSTPVTQYAEVAGDIVYVCGAQPLAAFALASRR
jgi:hypothetical protein